MDFKRFDSQLRPGAAALGVKLDVRQSERLYRYFQELSRWSKKVNLVSKNTAADQIVEKHFIDSLVLLNLFPPSGGKLLDVGSGAGFPGLVCKTARPEMTVHLVEPRLKRVSFLRQVIRLLLLEDIELHAARLEEAEILQEPRFDWIVSRALTNVSDFLLLCDRFKKDGSSVVCMKGPGYRDEFDEIKERGNGWHLARAQEYRLPFSGASRVLLIFQGAQTPAAEHDC
jgi:16S rRNA (guanine527-N7)-methyltransferase